MVQYIPFQDKQSQLFLKVGFLSMLHGISWLRQSIEEMCIVKTFFCHSQKTSLEFR